LICLFSSTLEFNNLFCSFKGEGTGAVRHLFSHHILKPERTPLENCVWGTHKGSGTFAALFESKLIPAKRYLDNPFEIAIETDESGKSIGTKKVRASNEINVHLVDSWKEFTESENASFIINGNSDSLLIPDGVVDLVITDPPYFDFIHYSELSDFFFAWLSPVLKDRYSFFESDNSSRFGEVQHHHPAIFSHQLSRVFAECHRVLVEDGLLIFSFHHSRPEGWAAIYEAIQNSGFKLVAAHPVYAEMKVASPKTSVKDPISLDAILVCRKAGEELTAYVDVLPKKDTIETLELSLKSAGIHLSETDRFVIWASQLLVKASNQSMGVEEVTVRLQQYSISS
jgi:putative DNA methylase